MRTLKLLLAIGLMMPVAAGAQQVYIAVGNSVVYAYSGKNGTPVKVDSAQQDVQGQEADIDAQRTRKISKSFSMDRNDKLVIDNQYGAILVKTWNKNEVKIDVDITAYSNSESDVQKLMDGVNVDGGKSGSEIVFKTSIADRNGNFSIIIRNGIKKRREVKVNYTVYMPANNALQLSQKYGNIEMGDFNGPTALRLQYGSLKAGTLNSSNNYINIQYGKGEIDEIGGAVIKHSYGSGLNIKEIGSLDLNASYVGITIGTVKKTAKIVQEYGSGINIGNVLENISIDAQYAKIVLGTVKGSTIIKSGYGNVTATSLNNTRINTDYATINIGTLNGDANIKMAYNNLIINNVNQTCRRLVFEGDYTGVNIGFASQFGGNYTVENAYGGFRGGENVTSRSLNSSGTKKEYKGKIGSGGPSNISIISSYGNVTFK